MDTWGQLAGLAGIWLLVVMIPGPNFVMVTTTAAGASRRAGLAAALGVSTGAAIWALSALLGLQALLVGAGWFGRLLRLAGAAYLVWLGVAAIRSGLSRGLFPEAAAGGPGRAPAFYRGLLTSISNPKTAVFFGSLFLSALPGDRAAGLSPAIVALVFLVSMGWYAGVALAFGLTPVRAAYRAARRALSLITGGLFVWFGLRLAWRET